MKYILIDKEIVDGLIEALETIKFIVDQQEEVPEGFEEIFQDSFWDILS